MNATTRPLSETFAMSKPAAGEPSRFVVHVGGTPCEIRARSVALIADVLGYETEMEVGFDSADTDGVTVADMLDSRMIEPYRPRRRRQRGVASRALFFATARE